MRGYNLEDIKLVLRSFLAASLILGLAACSTSTPVTNVREQVYNVSAGYFLLGGGWGKAHAEATEKAIKYCSDLGQKYSFISEQQTGRPGYTVLTSNITFSCGKDTGAVLKTIQTGCEAELQSPELDIIRTKIELSRTPTDGPPPFDIATNGSYPSAEEAAAIAKWARIRESCIKKSDEAIKDDARLPANAEQTLFFEKELEFRRQTVAQVSNLIIALYQGKLTYGEFAQKRYEMVNSIASANRDFRAAMLLQDRDAQFKAASLALEQQNNNLKAWATYMATVNSRQPTSLTLPSLQPPAVKLQTDCTTTTYSNTSSTHCN